MFGLTDREIWGLNYFLCV